MGIKKNSTADALFSKVQQRVLGLLYGEPHSTFHTNEIIRLTHSGTGATQRELSKMTIAGLLTVKQIGNQKHYQANSENPLFSELRSIVLKTIGLADILYQALQPIADKITFAFIYGSVAKQEDIAASDIDLMIISDKLSYADLYPLLEKAESQLHRSINPTFNSPSEWLRKLDKNEHFTTSLVKQPKIFIVGTAVELSQFRKSNKDK